MDKLGSGDVNVYPRNKFVILLCLSLAAVIFAFKGAAVAMLFLISPFLFRIILAIFVSLACFAAYRYYPRYAKVYFSECLRLKVQPEIPFILFLRPFSADFSPKFLFSDDCPVPVSSEYSDRDRYGRPFFGWDYLANSFDMFDCVRKLTDYMGVWVQAGLVDPKPPRVGIPLNDSSWRSDIALLCDAASLIVSAPLAGISLDSHEHKPSTEYASTKQFQVFDRILKKDQHKGLEDELNMLSSPTLIHKTILALPNNNALPAPDRHKVLSILNKCGFAWNDEAPLNEWQAHSIRLYRFIPEKGEMRGVEIVPRAVKQDEFASIAGDFGKRWVRCSGNAVKYLLEDDLFERKKMVEVTFDF